MNIPSSIPTVCFTGHRTLTESETNTVTLRLDKTIRYLVQNCGTRDFYAGGALGFDTISALAVLEAKKEFPEIALHILVPCRGQDSKWSASERKLYEKINNAADSVELLSERYYRGCMHARNRALLDAGALCVCCLREGTTTGGTAYTVKTAVRRGIPVINLLDDNFSL
jgi:uncharacterized phage-like protein YoqJ